MNYHAQRRAAALALSLWLVGAEAPALAAAPRRSLQPSRLPVFRVQPAVHAPARAARSAITAAPALKAAAAARVPAGILGVLRGSRNALSGAQKPGDGRARRALSRLFDGGLRALSAEDEPVEGREGSSERLKPCGEGCPGIGPRTDPSQPLPEPEPPAQPEPPYEPPIERFVRHAIREFFGELAPGQVPGVRFPRRSEAFGVEAAPTEGQMLSNVKESKRTNAERERIAIRLFVEGGAKYDPATAKVKVPDPTRTDEVQLQEVLDWRGRITGRHNIFVFKKGRRTDRILVQSGHVDKVSAGDGVIDNWVGTTLAAHLYQAERDEVTEATRLYITFAREEEGLVGSRFFLDSLPADQRARYEADLNYDTIAIKGGVTNSWENNSDEVLLSAADRAVAEANGSLGSAERLSLERARLNGGDSDSSSFRDAGIPGMTIYSGPQKLVFDTIHSERDNFKAFDLDLYKNTYRVALAILRWLDRNPLKGAGFSGI